MKLGIFTSIKGSQIGNFEPSAYYSDDGLGEIDGFFPKWLLSDSGQLSISALRVWVSKRFLL